MDMDDGEAEHSNWHKPYVGTASDQMAHEDMHRHQATAAGSRRDKACGAVESATAEMNALAAQSTAAQAKHDALMEFASEKTKMSENRSITTA